MALNGYGSRCKYKDLEWVQVHPTGLVKPDEPDSRIKFLAVEALQGVGGLDIDAKGKRLCNERQRCDYVTGKMWKNTPPFRLVLNYAVPEEIIWHCKHCIGHRASSGDGYSMALICQIFYPLLSSFFQFLAMQPGRCPLEQPGLEALEEPLATVMRMPVPFHMTKKTFLPITQCQQEHPLRHVKEAAAQPWDDSQGELLWEEEEEIW